MGVLVDYFTASADELAALDLENGPAAVSWPHVDCKGWLFGLRTLAGDLTGRDSSEFGPDRLLSEGGEEGPWLSQLPTEVTAALGGVTDARLRAYADDELLDDWELQRYTELRDLAHAAVAAGQHVYCWSSL